MIWLKRLALVLFAAALAAGLYLLIRPQPVPVDLATIARADIETIIEDEGKTRVKDVYRVSAPIMGQVERLTLKVGDKVIKGQRIARIRPPDPSIYDARTKRELTAAIKAAEAQVDLARAEIDSARAALDFARTEVERARALATRGTISTRSLEQAELDVEVKTAGLAQARANLELRRRELENARIKALQPADMGALDQSDQCCVAVIAPVSASVLELLSESQRVVAAGTPLIDLGDTANLEIVVDLLSADAVEIKPGTEARIEGWGGEGVLHARVRRIDPAGFTKVSALGIEEQRVNVVLDFTDPPERWARLGHAFRVVVKIIVSRHPDVIAVPISALFRDGEQWAVYRVVDGIAHKTKVTLGAFSLTRAEVTGGLETGDQVVVFPSDRIADGTAIIARGDDG